MAQTYKFGNGTWATKKGSTLAYSDTNNAFKPLPFSFERNSIGTRVNKEGLIEVVGSDVPRIDYTDSADGVLLLENSATNLLTYSEAFDNSYWIKGGSNVTSDFASPSGDLSSFKLATDTSNGIHYITKTVTSSLGKKTFSFYVDYTKNDYVSCSMTYNTNSRGVGIIINLTNDAVFDSINSSTDYTLNIKTVGNFKRIELSAQNTVDDILNTIFISPYNGEEYTWNNAKKTPSYQGDGTSGVYIFGAMLESNSVASSYIPTNGSIIQRAAETCNESGNSEVFNDSQGVLFANIAALSNDGTKRRITINNGSSSQFIQLEYRPTTDTLQVGVYNGASQGYFTESINAKLYNKIAYLYEDSNFKLYVSGFQLGSTITSGTTFSDGTLQNLSFDNGASSDSFKGKTKEIGYYDTVLTDAELETLTSYRSLNEMVTELNLNAL